MGIDRKQHYGMIDIVKFLCAILIVVSHYISEYATGRINSLIDYASSLYIIVVPFFFVCSGFFLFRKIFEKQENQKALIVKYCKRIMIMYLSWSTIYVVFNILTWMRFGITKNELLKYILNSIFYSTYQTIWFLPALCVGVILTYYLFIRIGLKYTLVVALFLYLIGAIGVSYSYLIEGTLLEQIYGIYNYVFVSARNGVFNGFLFVTIGALIAKKDGQKRENRFYSSLFLTIIFGVAFVIEAFILKIKFNAINANTLLFLVPFIYFFVRLCLNFKLKSGKVLLGLRKLSTVIFLCQRLWLTAIPLLFPEGICSRILYGNAYLGCVFVVGASFLTSLSIIFLANRFKVFSYLC